MLAVLCRNFFNVIYFNFVRLFGFCAECLKKIDTLNKVLLLLIFTLTCFYLLAYTNMAYTVTQFLGKCRIELQYFKAEEQNFFYLPTITNRHTLAITIKKTFLLINKRNNQ